TLRRDGFHHRGHTFFAPSPPLHSSQFLPSSSSYSPSHHTSCFFVLAMSLIASVADQLLLLYAAKMQTTTLLPLTEELLFSWASLCFHFDRQLCRMKVCLSLLSSLVSFISGVNETNTSKLNQEPEEHPQIYFLNGLGIFSAGVLAALARKDTKTAQATIESVNYQLGDRERALVTKEKDFEARLQLQQEEWNKEREKAQEEQLSLINQLNSAKKVVTGLGRELSSEKKLCEELRAQIESLQSSLSKAGEDGNSLETALRDKLKLIEGLQDRISLLSLELKDKKGEAQRIGTSLAEKEAELKKLNSAYAQTRGDLVNSEFQSAADTEVISRKEEEIQQIKMLDIELTNVQNLIHELEGAKETLQASRDSVSDLEKLLDESRALCSKIESEVSVIRGEFDEAKERYEEKLAEERGNSEVLARELAVEKDLLKKPRDELERLTHELEESSVKNQNLQKELVEIYNTNKKLEEERKTVLALEKDVKAMEKQMLMDREARKSLETDLEEAVSLEDKKEVLQRTLEEANKASKEAKESMEGAYSFLMSLRKEREVLEKKVKKLEEDLGSAKGEILRMRSQPNSVKAVNSTEDEEKSDDKVTAKKVVRRRKSSTSS
ncbi:hypothetical protein DY000_02042827, partial [Brassica cretica]